MDPNRILFVLRLPAILTVFEVGTLLGFHADAIRFLVTEGILEAIGQTEDVELKFDSIYIDGLRRNHNWKTRATKAWRAHVHERNQAQAAKRLANEKR